MLEGDGESGLKEGTWTIIHPRPTVIVCVFVSLNLTSGWSGVSQERLEIFQTSPWGCT